MNVPEQHEAAGSALWCENPRCETDHGHGYPCTPAEPCPCCLETRIADLEERMAALEGKLAHATVRLVAARAAWEQLNWPTLPAGRSSKDRTSGRCPVTRCNAWLITGRFPPTRCILEEHDGWHTDGIYQWNTAASVMDGDR